MAPWLLAAAGAILALALLLAALPLSWARATAERQLGAALGRAVTIGALERESGLSFRPVIALTDLRIAQPRWAGPGELAAIRRLRVRLHVLPLLLGRVKAEPLTVAGARFVLIRTADGRENWRDARDRDGGRTRLALDTLTVEDAALRYDDARQRRRFAVTLRMSPAAGLRLAGSGVVDGAPVRVRATGAPLVRARPWRFDAAIEGTALAIHVAGTMAAPLDLAAMDFGIKARADDLKRVDRIIEAGLFGTQPVDLRARVQRRPDRWTIAALAGTIGTSAFAGDLTVSKEDGRTKLDGRVRFARLNFDDLASDAGLARAAALERAQGARLVPNTRINIRKIDHTDGRIVVVAQRILGGRKPSSILNASGVLTLDHRLLTIDRLRLGLRRGAIVGKAVVDQRAGQAKPRVAIALDLRDSSVAALAGGAAGGVDARVDARARLIGVGDTIREAVGAADGRIGVAIRSGTLPETMAGLVGFDLGKGLFGSGDRTAALRCAALGLDLRHGRGTARPLVIDTAISQSTGRGTITFPDETLALALTGAPKGDALLRLKGPIRLGGTIRAPRVAIPQALKTAGGILKTIGRGLTGGNDPVATDADCGRLIVAALGGSRG